MDPRIRAGIFQGESGGDYDALLGFSNRPGGAFSDVRLTDMTINQAINFARGPYAQYARGQIGRVATPMGAYQIVGSTLDATKRRLGLSGDEKMTPEMQDRLGDAILASQGTGAWEGYRGPRDPATVRHGGGAGSQPVNFDRGAPVEPPLTAAQLFAEQPGPSTFMRMALGAEPLPEHYSFDQMASDWFAGKHPLRSMLVNKLLDVFL